MEQNKELQKDVTYLKGIINRKNKGVTNEEEYTMMQLRGLNEENKYLKRQIKEVQAINSQATKDLVDQHDRLISLKRQNKDLIQALNFENQSQS